MSYCTATHGQTSHVSLQEPGTFLYAVHDGAKTLHCLQLHFPTYPMLKRRFLMNEASLWRHALAQKIALHSTANPKVKAVAIQGSVAQGYADRFSDLDLAVFWTDPPTKEERRQVSAQVGGSHWHSFPPDHGGTSWSEHFDVGGVSIDVRHLTLGMMEGILAAVLSHADPSLPKQQRIAALLLALPLANPTLITHWQQQAAAYPHDLAVAMVRKHLHIRPAWEQEQLAERNEVLVLYDSFCMVQKHLLLALLGLNRLYYSGWRWLDRLMDEMQVTPPQLSSRFKQLFAILSIDPLASVYQLHELIEETFVLVETHLPAVDTRQARARFRERRASWEHAPASLL